MGDNSTQDQKSVPKFASFRPKASQTESASPATERSHNWNNDESSRDANRQRSSHYDHSSRRHRSRHERNDAKSSSRDEQRPQKQQGNQETPLIPVAPRNDDLELFAIDKLGDESNVRYGSLHRYDVPSYNRSGFGRVVGLSGDQKIDREASNEKYVFLSDNPGVRSNKRDRMAFAKLQLGGETRVKPANPVVGLLDDIGADFLPLSSQKASNRQSPGEERRKESPASSDGESHHYRSIQGKAKPSNAQEDPDPEYGISLSRSENEQISIPPDETLSRKIALSRRVDLEPENGDAWLDLIEYQEKIIMPRSTRQGLNAAERLSVADIKLSMYEKALDVVKISQYRERLLLGMMEEGSKIWETRKLASKWQIVLHENPHYVSLWTRYLDFEQTNFSTFRFDEVRDTFIKCMDILRAFPKEDRLIEIQIYVLLRFTLCLREAGFIEQSIAIWQGILEFNCRSPASSNKGNKLELTQKHLLEHFEEFWESEVPRIGEENSQGWAGNGSNRGELPQPRVDKPLSRCNSETFLETWHDREQMLSLQARRPARTIDDTVEDDPYRVVLFSDIKAFMLPLPPANQQALVRAFLAFCQLPPTENTAVQCMAWWKDPFIRNGGLQGFEAALNPSHGSTSDNSSDQWPLQHLRTSSPPGTSFLGPPITLYLPSTDLLFARSGAWFSIFDEWVPACAKNQGPVEVDWVRRVVRALVEADVGDNGFAEYLIALECRLAPSSAKKTAKALLRTRPTSLRLYNAYALVEARLGNNTAAESVWSTAINMGTGLDDKIRDETILLWRTWVWELLDSNNPKSAFERLLTLADEEVKPGGGFSEAGPAAILRTQRALTDGRDHALSFGDYGRTILYSECVTLLEYLANSLSIDAALSCFESQVSLLSSRTSPSSQAHELLHQARAKLLYYHTMHTHSFQPAVIRSTLEESIKLFPQNTIFLSMYAWNETRFRIDDRVRSIVHDVVLSSHRTSQNSTGESVVSLFFSIYTELTRSTTTGSNVYSIRASFERAIESQRGLQSAAMWKLYFLFEYSRGDLQKAKMVFYRAVRACPWFKELYLLAFQYLRGVTPLAEARGIYEMIVEKELRIFVSLDEAFEDRIQ